MTYTPTLAGLALLALLGGAMDVAHRPDGNPVIGTVTVGPDPGTLIVDTQTGRAFVGDQSSGRVDVLDTATGTLVRTVAVAPFPAGTQVDDLTADERLGRVFVLSAPGLGSPLLRGYVSALDARSGRLLSTTPVTLGGALDWLAVDSRARRVFVLGFPDYLPVGTTPDPVRDAVRVSVLDALSGHLVCALALPLPPQPLGSGAFAGSPLGVDQRTGRIFVSRFDGTLSVLDAVSGRLLRTVTVRGSRRATTVTAWGEGAPVVDARTNRVFVGDALRGTLSMLDAASGRLLRTTALPVAVYPNAPVVDEQDGRVFVVDDAGVSVLDAGTGRLLHRVVVGRNAPGFPPLAVIVDARHGRAFVVARREGTVGMLDSRSGRVLRTLSVGGHLGGAAVDSGAGRLVVTIEGAPTQAGTLAGPGLVGVLDERSGAIPWTIRVGLGPRAVAVDERTGHAVIATSGGTLPAPTTWGWLPAWLWQDLPAWLRQGLRTRSMPPGVSVLDLPR